MQDAGYRMQDRNKVHCPILEPYPASQVSSTSYRVPGPRYRVLIPGTELP